MNIQLGIHFTTNDGAASFASHYAGIKTMVSGKDVLATIGVNQLPVLVIDILSNYNTKGSIEIHEL